MMNRKPPKCEIRACSLRATAILEWGKGRTNKSSMHLCYKHYEHQKKVLIIGGYQV